MYIVDIQNHELWEGKGNKFDTLWVDQHTLSMDFIEPCNNSCMVHFIPSYSRWKYSVTPSWRLRSTWKLDVDEEFEDNIIVDAVFKGSESGLSKDIFATDAT